MSKRPRVNHPSGVRWRSVSANHPALAPFSSVPRHRDLFEWLPVASTIVPFLTVWAVFLPLLSLPFAKDPTVGGVVGFSGLALAVGALFAGQIWGRRRAARLLRQREEPLLSHRPSDSYVGVIYSDHLYLTPDGAWDRGWLTVDEGGLSFTGFATSFRLPYASLNSIELLDPKVDRPSFVFVRWTAPDGAIASLAMQRPDASNARQSREGASALTDLIQCQLKRVSSTVAPTWPPYIPSDRIRGGPDTVLRDPKLRSSLGRRALLLGTLTTAVSTAVLFLMTTTSMKQVAIALSPLPVVAGIVVGAASVERRATKALKEGADRALEDRRPTDA